MVVKKESMTITRRDLSPPRDIRIPKKVFNDLCAIVRKKPGLTTREIAYHITTTPQRVNLILRWTNTGQEIISQQLVGVLDTRLRPDWFNILPPHAQAQIRVKSVNDPVDMPMLPAVPDQEINGALASAFQIYLMRLGPNRADKQEERDLYEILLTSVGERYTSLDTKYTALLKKCDALEQAAARTGRIARIGGRVKAVAHTKRLSARASKQHVG